MYTTAFKSKIAAMLILSLASLSLAARDPLTLTYQVDKRGYHGFRAIQLHRNRPDFPTYHDDFWVGQTQQPQTHQVKTLIRFTDLNIPSDAQILSATIGVCLDGITQKPELAIYGMLKDWDLPRAHDDPSKTTWNDQYKPDTPWAAPGANKTTDDFIYDASADRLAQPDSVATINDNKIALFDVTRSFASQLAQDKLYGWQVVDLSGQPGTAAHATVSDSHFLTVMLVPSEKNPVVPQPPSEPHLITFNLAEHWKVAQNPQRPHELPFEGAVFYGVSNARNGDGVGWLCNSVFAPHKIEPADYTDFITNMHQIQKQPSPLQFNFIRVNLAVPGTLKPRDTPYGWEDRPKRDEPVEMWWSDKFDVVLHNIRIAAQVAREANMQGLLLDFEVYGGNIWKFDQLSLAREKGKTLEETKVQVRHCARRFTRSIADAFPDIELLVIPYGYDRPTYQDEILWLAFFDGMFEACPPRMRIIEGNELGYYINCRNEFQEMYTYDYTQAPQYSTAPEKYLQHLDVGFGLYIDRDGWGKNPQLNASSASWQYRVENALAVADSYVWVFTNVVDWWGGTNLPQEYIDATRTAINLAEKRRKLEKP